jgi:hypothetical protein
MVDVFGMAKFKKIFELFKIVTKIVITFAP